MTEPTPHEEPHVEPQLADLIDAVRSSEGEPEDVKKVERPAPGEGRPE